MDAAGDPNFITTEDTKVTEVGRRTAEQQSSSNNNVLSAALRSAVLLLFSVTSVSSVVNL
jgi:hypothetical protein